MDSKKNLSEIVNQYNQWLFLGSEITEILNNKEIKTSEPIKREFFYILCLIFKSTLKVLYLYFLQIFSKKEDLINDTCKSLVAKTEREYRHENFFFYINKNNSQNYKTFYAFERNSFTSLKRVKLKGLFIQLFFNFRTLDILMKRKLPRELKELIKRNSSALATYSYFCALFREIKTTFPDLELFSDATLLSQSAIKENVNTHLLCHGLIEKENKINFPHYSSVYVYSQDEANLIKNILPSADVNIYQVEKVKHKLRRVICFLNFYFEKDKKEQEKLRDLIIFFQSNNFEVVLKHHKEFGGKNTKLFYESLGIKFIKEEDISTSSLLFKEKPYYTVGWRSTSLCVSLRAGIIPISLSEISDKGMSGIPYLFKDRVLFWKEDFDEIKSLVEEKSSYSEALSKLLDR